MIGKQSDGGYIDTRNTVAAAGAPAGPGAEHALHPCKYPVEGLDFPNDPDAPDFRIEFVSHSPTEDVGNATWRGLHWVVSLDICARLFESA